MQTTAELAGFFAAHAMWCIAEGDGPLVPLVAFIAADGERNMRRFVSETYEESVGAAREWIAANTCGAERVALIFDGYITLPTGRTDALIVEARRLGGPPRSFEMAIPYRSAESAQGFAVHRPKFTGYEGEDSPNYSALADAFFKGVDSHTEGAAVWNAKLDQSI